MSEEKKRAAIVTNHSTPAVEVFAAGHASSRKNRSKQREKAEECLLALAEQYAEPYPSFSRLATFASHGLQNENAPQCGALLSHSDQLEKPIRISGS